MGHQSVMELTHTAAAADLLRLRQFCVGSGELTLQTNNKITGCSETILVGR